MKSFLIKSICIISLVFFFLTISLIFVIWLEMFSFLSYKDCKPFNPNEVLNSSKLYENVSDYLAETSKIEKIENNELDTNKVNFIFANNPYNFNEKSWLFIYINNKRAYEGNFSLEVPLPSLSQFVGASGKGYFTINFTILHPVEKGKYAWYTFQNKSIVYWESDYKIIYAAFFPTNQDIDEIHFFPTKYPVMQ